MSIVIVVGGSSSVVVVKSLVSVLVEFVAKSEDWSTRKAAAEGLEKLAVVYRDLLLEFKASCLKTFEVKRFDKLGVDTVPVFVGPVSYLLLSKPAKDVEKTFDMLSLLDKILSIYNEGIAELKEAGATWIQFDEATLVKDLEAYQLEAFTKTYSALESACSGLNVIVATYFADVPAEAVKTLTSLPGVSGYTFDLVRGEKTLGLIKNSFPSGKYLFAGLFDGRNIWANDLAGSVAVLESLEGVVGKDSGHILVRGKRNIRLLKLLKLIVMEDIQQKCHK